MARKALAPGGVGGIRRRRHRACGGIELKLNVFVAAAALGAAVPVSAQNAANDFRNCDGWSIPEASTPEKALERYFTGLNRSNGRWDQQWSENETGIRACNAALDHPVMIREFWLRRIELLHAKALHQIASGKFEDALQTLNVADSTTGVHPWFLREQSLAVGSQALRGYALFGLGRAAEAEQALAAAEQARPFSPSVGHLTRTIRLMGNLDADARTAILERGAALDPTLLKTLFWLAFLDRDYASAVRYGAIVTFDSPRDRPGWYFEDEHEQEAVALKAKAGLDGARAYALLASGKPDEARGMMEAVRERLRLATLDLQGKPLERLGTKSRNLVSAAREASANLDAWDRAMAARSAPTAASIAGVSLPVHGDLLRAVVPANETERSQIAAALARSDALDARLRGRLLDATVGEVGRLLPLSEFNIWVPRMRPEGGMFTSRLNGFHAKPDPATGRVNLRFGSESTTRTIIEEAALLASANYVASLGKDGFIVEASDVITRTVQMGGIGGFQASGGMEGRVLLRPVTMTALPPELEASRWRIIKVAEVQAALAGRFAER